MIVRTGMAALMLGMAMPAAAQTAGATSPMQARFDEAAAAVTAGRTQEAAALYAGIEADLSATPASANLAIARLRLAEMLWALGRPDEAARTLDLAIASPALARPALAGTRYDAFLLRGALSETRFEPDAALADYQAALAAATAPAERARALLSIARVRMFSDPDAAARDVDQAIAAIGETGEVTRDLRGSLIAAKGRAFLNKGDFETARTLLDEAIRLSGGLDRRVTTTEMAMRGDMAMALLRLGRTDDAKRYFAYTGAGQSRTVTLPIPLPPASIPLCGEGGIEPDDVAVIEFDIRDDGSVANVRPVYASRRGRSAWIFARAAADWRFDPAAVAALPGYMRRGNRILARCARQAERPRRAFQLDAQLESWLAGPATGVATAADADLRRTIAAARTAGEARERLRLLDAAIAGSARSSMPLGARVALRLERIAGEPFVSARRDAQRRLASLDALALEPDVAADPQVRAVVALERADAAAVAGDETRQRAILEQAVADAGLDRLDPLRVAALVALANARARAGDMAGAEAAYGQTGLTAQQCALIDGGPRLKDAGVGFRDFPEEALRWGFEGWTQVEFDVDADGRTVGRRTVLSYPPDVFSEGAERGVGRARYETSYRPDGDPGCVGATLRIRFMQPR